MSQLALDSIRQGETLACRFTPSGRIDVQQGGVLETSELSSIFGVDLDVDGVPAPTQQTKTPRRASKTLKSTSSRVTKKTRAKKTGAKPRRKAAAGKKTARQSAPKEKGATKEATSKTAGATKAATRRTTKKKLVAKKASKKVKR